jgi:hypothetical protein
VCTGGRCLRLTTLPPSCGNCLEIRERQTPGNLGACNRPVYRYCFTFAFYSFSFLLACYRRNKQAVIIIASLGFQWTLFSILHIAYSLCLTLVHTGARSRFKRYDDLTYRCGSLSATELYKLYITKSNNNFREKNVYRFYLFFSREKSHFSLFTGTAVLFQQYRRIRHWRVKFLLP